VEEGKLQQIIQTLWGFDDTGAISLDLALGAVCQREQAIEILEGHEALSTEPVGVVGKGCLLDFG
jgi:hypothetical protein